MRKILAIAVAMVPGFAALAEQPGPHKSAPIAASGKLLPLKGATSGNSCAAYGAGFVKVEGSETCVKVGGYVSTGASATMGAR